MSRFTRLQYCQLIVFVIFWFVFFPLIWFLARPEYFASSIWKTLLFAFLLLITYCVIYTLINKCCCQPNDHNRSSKTPKRFWSKSPRRGAENPVYSPTTTSGTAEDLDNKRESRIPMPDTVMYEIKPRSQKPGLVCYEEPLLEEETKNVRFITSCSLYYDGHDFHDA